MRSTRWPRPRRPGGASRSRPPSGHADVELSVRDAGTGLPPQVDGTLFTPFVTTKPHGLGDRAHDCADDCRRTWRHHRWPQQSRPGCDVHGHPASQQGDRQPVGVAGCRMSVSSRFSCAVLAGCLVLCGPPVEAQPPAHPHVQQILLLQGVDRGSVTVDSFTANFRVDLDERVGRPVNVVQVVVTPTGFVGAPEHAVVDYIRSTFANRSKPGAHRDGRRSCGGLRAQVSTAALSRYTTPLRGCRPTGPGRRAPREERDRRRRRQRFSAD